MYTGKGDDPENHKDSHVEVHIADDHEEVCIGDIHENEPIRNESMDTRGKLMGSRGVT